MQWNDTLAKLDALYSTGHSGDIMIPTKTLMSKEQQRYLSSDYNDIWIFFAITGLDELGLGSLQPYEDTYLRLCEDFDNIVCAFRPIMPGKNDKEEIVSAIIDMVSKGNRLLTYTGYKDIYDRDIPQYQNQAFFDFIEDYCALKEVLVKQKCYKIIEAARGTVRFREEYDERGLELARKLGYKLEVFDGTVHLLTGDSMVTKGDVNFVKFLTSSSLVSCTDYVHSQLLSISHRRQTLVCTSSWFQWARQVPCAVGCSYCFADYHSVIRTQPSRFGCNPIDISSFI